MRLGELYEFSNFGFYCPSHGWRDSRQPGHSSRSRHSPKDRSLCIKIEPSAPAGLIVYSHAQDDNLKCKDFVLGKLGLEPFRPRHSDGAANSNQKIIAAYDYKDATGKLLYQVVRFEPKVFRHRQPDGKGGWIYKGSEQRVLYRLPDLLKYPDATIFVCEGEKDADRLASLGYCATTVASGKWTRGMRCSPGRSRRPHYGGQ